MIDTITFAPLVKGSVFYNSFEYAYRMVRSGEFVCLLATTTKIESEFAAAVVA